MKKEDAKYILEAIEWMNEHTTVASIDIETYGNLFINSQNLLMDVVSDAEAKEATAISPLASGSFFHHLMVDIETMGNESFSSIVSIGAVEFDINTGKIGKEFYVNVDLQSCVDLGLTINASTVMWWMKQNEQARKDLTDRTTLPIIKALEDFAEFCNKDYQIWGNSARFDCGILQNAYNKAGIPIPWDFRKERCVRTLVSFVPEIKVNYKSIGTAHNAVDDCKFQIGYCSDIWRSLNCH